MSENAENGGGNGDDDRSESERRRDESDSDSDSDGQEGASTAEKVVIALSVAVTVLLFAYAGWQIATPPQAATPQATVVETTPLDNGSVAVTVRLRNPGDIGLITATVESSCASPPVQVQFSYVPALSTRTGTLVCPPGTTNPSVSVANWVPA